MIPSPLVGSGVDVRQTVRKKLKIVALCHSGVEGSLSTSSSVKVPRRSYCVPLEVTVKFKLMPAHDPMGPQFHGGLVCK
jgi:hypothetical protein